MATVTTHRTTCNRDCPDACGILADVEDGRVVALRGDKDHPVTRGFLCHRTNRFLERQYRVDRLTTALVRKGDRQVPIGAEAALDLAAERLTRIRVESGAAAVFHYRSGGSLGLLKPLADYLFEQWGPVTGKRGDICSGAGEAAQEADLGASDSHDLFDRHHARHVLNWGKHLHVSNVHLWPVVTEARRRGARLTTIDPVRTRTAADSDRYIAPRPGGDAALACAVARLLFESGRVAPDAAARCDGVDAFRTLVHGRTVAAWCAAADVPEADARHLADALADGPTAILVGWGLQRRAGGGTTVRLLDALSAISGNLHRKGGGASFYYKRRGAFDLSFLGQRTPPREIVEPLLGAQVLAAQDPPIRAIWVTAGNPVAMLPDSRKVAEAFERTEFTVVCDTHPTDTTRRASLVLPVATLLEDDDLLGAYGHHWLGASQPVVPPPGDVRTDLGWLQGLAARLGVGDRLAGTAREWKQRLLRKVADRGVTVDALERGAVRNPLASEVLFADGRVATKSGRVQLVSALAPSSLPPSPLNLNSPSPSPYPLWLCSNSTPDAQSSQWVADPTGPLVATLHPEAAAGLPDGARARLVSELGALDVVLRHDPTQRRDLVIVPKGGHLDSGHAANAIIPARCTDLGEGAAYQDARVRVEPLVSPSPRG